MKSGQTGKRKIQKMRIFRGLENIHSVIDRHEAEWRREQGEEPERPRLPSLEESVRRRLTATQSEGSGKFSADRFLGGKTEPVTLKKPPMPEPEPANAEPEAEPETASVEPEAVPETEAVNTAPESSPADTAGHSWLYNEVMNAVNTASAGSKDTKIVAVFVPVIQSEGEARDIPADDDEADYDGENVRAVEIIRNKDGRHSRLYDEVMSALNDAADDSRRIVAVFVPLLQDGKEFENLPADETITLSPVSEDAVRIETPQEAEAENVDISAAPVEAVPVIAAMIAEVLEPESEPLQEIILEPEAVQEIALEPETVPELEPVPEVVPEPEPEPVPEVVLEPEPVPEIVPEPEPAPEIIPEPEPVPEVVPETEPKQETQQTSAEDFDLIPEGKVEADTELAEAFREMEEKLDEATDADEQPAPEQMPEPEIPEDEQQEIAPDTYDDDEDDILADGEPMEFQDIDTIGQDTKDEQSSAEPEEILLLDELDDDEILDDGEFDETLTEIQRPDDNDDDDDIEIIPDPV